MATVASAKTSEDLIDFLIKENFLTAEHIDFARSQARGRAIQGSGAIVNSLIAAGLLNEWDFTNYIGATFQMPVAKITSVNFDVVRLVAQEAIERFRCMPVGIEKDTVYIAIADPTQLSELKNLHTTSGQPTSFVLTSFQNLDTIIESVLSELGQPVAAASSDFGFDLDSLLPDDLPKPKPKAKQGVAGAPPAHRPLSIVTERKPAKAYPVKRFNPRDPVPAMINEILNEAVSKGASDVHIESQPQHIRVRFRIEGGLIEVYRVPLELKDQLSSRVKVLAGLDISERRLPQDGRLKIQVGKAEFNFRLNVMPTHLGESMALRVLRPESVQLDLTKVGFLPQQLELFKRGIESPNGIVLVTGPTGSGKTTTLYTALAQINRGVEKIATVEDPVEYTLEGITQVQINTETGLSFAKVLKALLRQDPDVLLVGEIRDQETAAVAIQAALSGHLVLSTLHTNDAPSAVLRLLNMGIEPFMVLASVRTVVAQRLLRKICTHCKKEDPLSPAQLGILGEDHKIISGAKLFKGVGCDRCLGGGYKGRIAAFEVLELTDGLKESLLKGENPVSFRRKAIAEGMQTLRQSALHLVAAGDTSIEEAIASTVDN